jgi:hypothetical protein
VVAAMRPKPFGRAPPKITRLKPLAPAGVPAWVQIAIFLCALIGAEVVCGDELRCPQTNVVVYSADGRDVAIACEAAGQALGFFAANDLDTTGAVEVHLVSKLPDVPNSSSSYGCYDHWSRRVYMLFLSGCLEQGPWAELPIDRALYKSLLTHEVAHAVADANFSVPKPGMLAHEYLAYVTMFATMPPGQRERVLKRFPGEGFDSVEQMSVTYYLMNPLRFGAEAYRHFLKLDDRKTFLKDVLSGRVQMGRNVP